MKEVKINIDTLKALKETAKGYVRYVEESYKGIIPLDIKSIIDQIKKAIEEAEGLLQ